MMELEVDRTQCGKNGLFFFVFERQIKLKSYISYLIYWTGLELENASDDVAFVTGEFMV